ncbi:MAG: hypothetical protein CML61_05770 [Rhodobacteraceae bacterium]|nr:hypothetical protein [Paracoccaceae bacterium]
MLVALIAHDKKDAQNIRADNRPAHLDYLNTSDCVFQAGPLLTPEGGMAGSLIVLDVPDLQAAQDWADADPYAKAGLFEKVELIEWKKVIG